ncbi:MAG: hypothetical protein J6D36_01680 [Erysipelotrichaceae bacterium]|nr:hypothetical protein [Erysipelotrichaceae bacterium]
MRLIDADKLKGYYSTELSGYVKKNEEINEAETVDAIPIDFIHQQIKNIFEVHKRNTLEQLINSWHDYNSRNAVVIEDWHLTSEGDFPKLCGDYLYTIKFTDGRASVGYIFLGPEECREIEAMGKWLTAAGSGVIAWTKLPEPYRPDKRLPVKEDV